ncbi:hypothetical protein ONS95_012909 [Cadophora gregata]|uniref:uncharacterized protein n=1 Tax=Cadophora gregata TaxID=51156 RepID=UPI0026DA9B3B|nr:uncharacterized protein ONS95_012909 [Cadophora gregata]KAK0101107.1 hypothetical protein ONS96_006334 [Cadophora gregata f. sp. sojae]KAK0115861.1 hypothetical protein ONS95_012909 [Cadophora gregata]
MSNSTPTPLPKYIYKILPSTPAPPTPLPASLPLSALDSRHNFMHLSTSSQILRTLQNFFSSESHVYILRIPYERVARFIVWEDTKGNAPPENEGAWDVDQRREFFPHVYGNAGPGEGEQGLKMGREEVESVGVWRRGSGEGSWRVEGWPFGEDGPRE